MRDPQFKAALKKVSLLFTLGSMGVILGIVLLTAFQQGQQDALKEEAEGRTRVELSLLLHTKAHNIRTEFKHMLQAKGAEDLNNANQSILSNAQEIRLLLTVLDSGGEYTEIIRNTEYGKDITQDWTYQGPEGNQPTPLAASSIRSGLERLEEMRLQYFRTLRGFLGSPANTQEERILVLYEKLGPLFSQLSNDSWNLYSQSKEEYHSLVKHREDNRRFFGSLYFILLLAVTGGLFILGWRTIDAIRTTLQEQNDEVDTITRINAELEEVLEERIASLDTERAMRRIAEAKNLKRSEFQKKVLESLGHPFYVINAKDFSIFMSNQMARDHAAVARRHCATLGNDLTMPCFCEEEKDCLFAEIKRNGKPIIREHKYHLPSGGHKHLEIHAYPIFNQTGEEVVQIIAYSLDVTEKHEAKRALERNKDELEIKVRERTELMEKEMERRNNIQAELERSEHHFRNLLDTIRDVILIVDRMGIIRYITPSVQQMLGFNPDDLVGRTYQDLVILDETAGDEVRPSENYFSDAVNSAEPLEHLILDIHGDTHLMESFVQDKFDDPAIRGLLITSRDISIRKRAEQMETRFEAVVDQNPSSIIITNTRGTIEYVNPQFEKVTGYTREEILGQNPRVMKSGDTSMEVFEDMYATIEKGEVWRGEFINRKKSGERYTENVVITPIKNQLGEITHYVALKENITELIKAREQAELANRAKSDFLSRMSHELRTPLNAIIGFSNLLLQDPNDPLHTRHEGQVKRIHSAGTHLMQMISEILDFSSIESGKLNISMDRVAPADVIHECLMLTDNMAAEAGINLTTSDLDNLPTIHVDRIRLKQIMVNFITNAIKYNVKGGSISITAKASGNAVSFSVADTGTGIAVEKQASLFTPFTRLAEDASTIEGTGIGLTICKQLAEAMEGSIAFTSVPGVGSTFTVTFRTAENLDNSFTLPDDNGSGTTVLFIGDEKKTADELKNVFAEWPTANFFVRKNAQMGLKAVTMLKPDIVLMAGDAELIETIKSGSQPAPLIIAIDDEEVAADTADIRFRATPTLKEILEVYQAHQGATDA